MTAVKHVIKICTLTHACEWTTHTRRTTSDLVVLAIVRHTCLHIMMKDHWHT